MDRQDFTRDWYQKQNFNSPEIVEMRDFRRPRPATDRMYSPSDNGDYRKSRHEEPFPDYQHMDHHIDKRYVPMPGIALARNRNSYAGVGVNQRNVQNGNMNRFSDIREGYVNGGFAADKSPRNSGAYVNPDERQRPQSVAPRSRESAVIMYDGNKYTASEYNHYIVPGGEEKERPAWIAKASPYNEKNKMNEKSGLVCSVGILARIIVIVCIVWDLSMDWLLVSTNINFGNSENMITCSKNANVSLAFGNITTTEDPICGVPSTVWKVFAAFSLIGSLLSIIQIINIGCEMIKTCKPSVFQVLHGQSEVLLVLFFEELPQIGLTMSFFSLCVCHVDNNVQKTMALYGLLSVISAAVSVTARYATSFGGLALNGGCCNTWWRCACCKNPDYFCRVQPREVCCTCNVPCPLCCCTLYCRSCKWSPQTWCAPLMKAFSCFCDCCKTDDEMYGIRMVNNLGLLVLWFCSSFQIAIYIITYG
ncbi:uncharacterized protein LOC133179082 [Saccostrea echinata]|uniref:uncharacterized protein LOC133179082 n=1 Tax=Saccostrea echinata TaxID=191078 RepID=UPI002A820A3A|nr:uncharacterized protein LOC133179082 [Saccostrea echinata]